jgi:hypothetical protein
MKTKTFIASGLLAAALSSQAAVISFSDGFTDDASTGISTDNIYTHTIGGGQAATVNGVSFDLLNTSTTPANFTWTETNSNGKNQVTNNNNDWDPANGGVTGPGIDNLLDSFTFANGLNSSQTFTLSGLTIGDTYDTRLYIRKWADGSTRTIDFDFTNGAEVTSTTIDEDDPTTQGYPNTDYAYYLNYRFTAQATTLTIDAAPESGSSSGFHLYALTNQFVPEPSSTALLGLGLSSLLLRRKRS